MPRGKTRGGETRGGRWHWAAKPGAGVKRRIVLLALVVALLPHIASAARHKAGPIYMRGIAQHVSASGFTLTTTHHGSYTVSVLAATRITVKGKPAALRTGDHVGVHGFLAGRTIRAIYVHIYPIKPKPFSIKGTVTAVSGDIVRVASGGKTYSVLINSKTVIKLGLQVASLSAVRIGAQVDVRLLPGSPDTAVEIRIHRPPQIHLRLKGTLQSFDGTYLTLLSAGQTYRVRIARTTVIYLGNRRTATSVLRAGRSVTVYVCCQGQPLVATSIHVKRVVVKHDSALLHGRIVAVGSNSIRVLIGSGIVTISLTASTAFHVGLTVVKAGNLRPGDQVSIRAYHVHGNWVATEVHVYASSRKARKIDGTVVSVRQGRVTVLDRGRRYVLIVPSGDLITINGRRVALGALRPGDRLHTVARPGAYGLVAGTMSVTRAAPPSVTIKGTLVGHAGWVLTVAVSGKRLTVRPARGVRVKMGHVPAPPSALFPGVPVSARGTLARSTLTASRISLETQPRVVTGRVTAIGNGTLSVKEHTGRIVVVRIARDGTSIGTDVAIHGFTVATTVYGVALQILHPSLDLTGVAAIQGKTIILIRTNGDRYVLQLAPNAPVTTVRATMTLTMDEIPSGVHLHATGQLQTDGTLRLSALTVHLASVSLRAPVTSLAPHRLSVGGKPVSVVSQTRLLEGSRVVTLADLVVGDDVTIDGYDARAGILAREILLHRRLEAVDGTVEALSDNGFALTTATGTIQVVTTAATDSGGLVPAVGLSLHVTGYLRGDGTILATRLRPGPKHGT